MKRFKTITVAALLAATAQVSATDLIFKSSFELNALVSGQLLGLGAEAIQLKLTASGNNEIITLNQSGSFIFESYVAVGATWQVTIEQMPAQQQCDLSNASGNMTSAGDGALIVNCSTTESKWDMFNWDEGDWQ